MSLNGNLIITSKNMGKFFFYYSPQPFTKNGDQFVICYNLYGPKGAWQLGTCHHMYHLPCLIMLMVARRRCPQCKAPFHRHLYAKVNIQTAMLKHWEYNWYNTSIDLNHGVQRCNGLASGHITYFIEESIWQMTIEKILNSKGMWSLIPYAHQCEMHMILPNIPRVV
jgi:hypothetical protein